MDHNDASTTEPGLASRVFTRRSAVKAAAWSVPVITVVSAAPAFAASTDTWTVANNGSARTTAAGVPDQAGAQARLAFLISAVSGKPGLDSITFSIVTKSGGSIDYSAANSNAPGWTVTGSGSSYTASYGALAAGSMTSPTFVFTAYGAADTPAAIVFSATGTGLMPSSYSFTANANNGATATSGNLVTGPN